MKSNLRVYLLRLSVLQTACVLCFAGSPQDAQPHNEVGSPGAVGVASWFARGTLAEEKGDVTTALKHYQEALLEFDASKKIAAEALLRMAAHYQVLGASESSDATYSRLVKEFGDIPEVQGKIPADFKVPESDAREQDLLAVVEELISSRSVAPIENASGVEDLALDPRKEERRLELESFKTRVERSRSRRDEAYDRLQDAEIRLKNVKASPPSSLPDSVKPGAIYAQLKTELIGPFDFPDEKTNETLRLRAERRIIDWVKGSFIPELEAEYKASMLSYEAISQQYQEDRYRYQDVLKNIRDEEMVEAEQRRRDAKEAQRQIVIMGKVRQPGFYELPEKRISVIELIAMAGGFMPNSKKVGIKVSRQGASHTLSFDAELGLSPNDRFTLEKGDVITVPERFF